MFEWPLPPVPIQPMVMRLLGATPPALPRADEDTKYGRAITGAAFFKN
jgi:hypothetical protein